MKKNRINFLNINIDNVSKQEAVAYIEECISNGKIGHVITPNVDQIVQAETDAYFRNICQNADLLLCDSRPLIWISRMFGTPIKEQICGSDLVPYLCKLAWEKGYSVFFLGAEEGVAALAAEKLKSKYPGIKIAGIYSPPYGFENDENEIAHINDILSSSNADFLFVGLGAPKQDFFIYENKDKYKIPMSFSIGASIDFIAGKFKRCPRWMTNIGLEWFYRMIQEPKRLIKRYLVDDMQIFPIVYKYYKNRNNITN